MSTQTASSQLKVTLPDQILNRLKSKSDKLGLKPAAYIRHLVISDLDDDRNLPVYQMTPQFAEFLRKQMKEYHAGKTKMIDGVDELMNSL